ncbi:alpha/beta fold hydrolase [Sphingomonas daechungensis]|uniref:Alpha/beta fold hydrolase n=2 Tax=Sphingomonas daechungensis TaxID=1176646 RepID=A0ABX6T3C5_9SPHN|nr:alpha/beta fold hydrolase [Sphingomonas daechungensis]
MAKSSCADRASGRQRTRSSRRSCAAGLAPHARDGLALAACPGGSRSARSAWTGGRAASAGHSGLPCHGPDDDGPSTGLGACRMAGSSVAFGAQHRAKKDTLKLLEKRLNEIGKGKPVLVVGWSLGGMFARQLAHRCPKKVRAVVTLGSPFSGNLKTNTNVREFYERIAGHDVNEPPFPHVLDKPPVPTLALWSRRDGIVAPSAARGLDHERDKAVEIDSYHTGFAVHRPVLMQIVNEIRTFLAEAEGWPPTLQPLVVAAPFAKA